MFLLKKVKKILDSKGYMVSVKIKCDLTCVVLTSPYAQSLYSILRNHGAHVSFLNYENSVLVYDKPEKFFNILDKIR